ncbi:MAG: S24 family peptidase [Burkholderiaceae bacterium]
MTNAQASTSGTTYALMVEGDSMVSTAGTHSFPPGTVLIVDPERAPNAGDFVIANDVVTQQAMFKQLTTDGSRWYLRSLNPAYAPIEIDDPAQRVIGRVIEARPPSVNLEFDREPTHTVAMR